MWQSNADFKNLELILNKVINVTNDAEGRGVKLMLDNNNKIATDEDQKQALYLMVSHFRKDVPINKSKKLNLMYNLIVLFSCA